MPQKGSFFADKEFDILAKNPYLHFYKENFAQNITT